MKHRTNPSSIRNHRITHRQSHRRTKRRTAFIAAGVALGVAMAATGTTYALWHASQTISGGTITAGNLALTSQKAATYWDVSTDRTDATDHINALPTSPLGHSIDLGSWRMVPGDKIALAQQVKVELEGDNLTAALAVTGLDKAKNLPINWTYQINEAATGQGVASGQITTKPSTELAYFTATDRAASGGRDWWPVTGGEVVLEVVIYAELPTTVSGTDYTRVNQALADLSLDLNQVRGTN